MTARDILALIRTTPDARGECDGCHHDGLDLWEPEQPNCGDFAYCRECWTKRARLKAAATPPLRDAVTAIKALRDVNVPILPHGRKR